MSLQLEYFTAYQNLKLTRNDKGVLVAEFHTNGGPFIMTAQSLPTILRERQVYRRRIGKQGFSAVTFGTRSSHGIHYRNLNKAETNL